MTQEKMRKVITACVSAATVLFVLLLGFLVYQWVTMAILNKRIAEAEEAVSYWEQQVEENEKNAEYYESEFYRQWAYQGLLAGKGKN